MRGVLTARRSTVVSVRIDRGVEPAVRPNDFRTVGGVRGNERLLAVAERELGIERVIRFLRDGDRHAPRLCRVVFRSETVEHVIRSRVHKLRYRVAVIMPLAVSHIVDGNAIRRYRVAAAVNVVLNIDRRAVGRRNGRNRERVGKQIVISSVICRDLAARKLPVGYRIVCNRRIYAVRIGRHCGRDARTRKRNVEVFAQSAFCRYGIDQILARTRRVRARLIRRERKRLEREHIVPIVDDYRRRRRRICLLGRHGYDAEFELGTIFVIVRARFVLYGYGRRDLIYRKRALRRYERIISVLARKPRNDGRRNINVVLRTYGIAFNVCSRI